MEIIYFINKIDGDWLKCRRIIIRFKVNNTYHSLPSSKNKPW